MKLWEIKAQALKLMFADSDIQFSENEFTDGIVYQNSNTRDKLTRMNDSVRRAIDLYYTYVGVRSKSKTFTLTNKEYIDLSTTTDFGSPDRVDLKIYSTDEDNEKNNLVYERNQVDFIYNEIEEKIEFEEDFSNSIYDDYILEFRVYYKIKKLNIDLAVDEITFDLDSIYIPNEVQRNIPFYIKSELFEEDEPQLAINAKNSFISFLMTLQKPFSRVQTKVKKPKVFGKTN
jgi:hypothetical protein